MKLVSRTILFLFLLCAVTGFLLWHYREPVIRKVLETGLNETQRPFFAGTARLRGVDLTPSLKLRIQEMQADWQTLEGAFPIEVHRIHAQDSLLNLVFQKPVRMTFEQFRPRGSLHPGIQGYAVLNQDAGGSFELRADFAGLYLEEIMDLDPENLRGASGKMTGHFYLKTDPKGDQSFQLNLEVTEPGGRLGAHFFELLLPYLPPVQKQALSVIRQLKTVGYKKADLAIRPLGPEAINLILHILVPDYNLHLNLNLEIRVEEKDIYPIGRTLRPDKGETMIRKWWVLVILCVAAGSMEGCTVKAVGDPERPITINANVVVDIRGLKQTATGIEDMIAEGGQT